MRAFFGNSTPLTGAGKAALAGAFMKENNEPAARELVISGLARLISSISRWRKRSSPATAQC